MVISVRNLLLYAQYSPISSSRYAFMPSFFGGERKGWRKLGFLKGVERGSFSPIMSPYSEIAS